MEEFDSVRFFGYVDLGVSLGMGCWEWSGAKFPDGYGAFRVGQRVLGAHRVLFQFLVGSDLDGLQLDHLCRNPPCVNPDHLEPVTPRVNALRGRTGNPTGQMSRAKTHCPRSHPYSGDNLLISTTGARVCRACNRLKARKYRAAKKSVANDS